MREMLKNRVGGALVALVLATGVGIAAAAPAQAALSDCSSGEACFWDATGNTGGHVDFQNYIPVFGSWGYSNKASSLYNHGANCTVWFYSGTYGDGYEGYNSKGSYWADLSAAKMGSSGLSWNNQIDSGYFCDSQQ